MEEGRREPQGLCERGDVCAFLHGDRGRNVRGGVLVLDYVHRVGGEHSVRGQVALECAIFRRFLDASNWCVLGQQQGARGRRGFGAWAAPRGGVP